MQNQENTKENEVLFVMKILTSTQFKELDKYTIGHEPVSSIDLMERAAKAIAAELKSRWTTATRFIVFAGPGNNGGDALAVSRLLCNAGYTVQTYLFNITGRLSDDCLNNKKRLENLAGLMFTEVSSQFSFPEVDAKDVIIDGLFGTGLNKPLDGGYAGLVKRINASPAKVVSIDIPSGLMSEDNTYNNPSAIVRADLTLTIQLPKLAFFFGENQKYLGEVKPVDIGLSAEGLAAMDCSITVIEPGEVKKILKPRNPFAHKGSMGHALLVSGQYGMGGATILAAKACLRSGVGKLTVHTPDMNNNILQCSVPEAILSHDLSDIRVSKAISTYDYNALAIGPGLGTHEETAEALRTFIRNHPGEMVLDADALNILGNHPEWIPGIPQDTILTPHPKELENLVGACTDSYDRMAKARELSIKMQLYVIVKGHNSMICTPTGRVIINPTGNAGMATAGSGDVLTGILTALLARGYTANEACQLGTYLHGMAGDIARERLGEESMIASDIIDALPEAFKKLKE